MTTDALEQGTLGRGLAHFKMGSGPPLVYIAGLSADHRQPQGIDRWLQRREVRPLTAHRTVWWLNRREGLEPDVTMAEIAADYADVLRASFDGPVDVMGISTGGSVALQLTVDHPELVRSLVLTGSGCRLGVQGKSSQLLIAELARAGRQRAASAEVMGPMGGPRWTQALLTAIGWLGGSAVFSIENPADMLATIQAEDPFDVTDRLGEIRVPVLVLGGALDHFYDDGRVFAETAAGIAGARLILYPGKGHLASNGRRAARDAVAFFTRDR